MDRKLWAAAAVAAAAIGVWIGVQAFGSGDGSPERQVDTPAVSPDPDYWSSERMRDATPAPMPTVD